jgi:hypothetical protein
LSKPIRNAADEGGLESQRQAEHNEKRRRRDDLKQVLGTREGRRLLNRLIQMCGVYDHGFEPSGQKMAYEKGQRDIGVMIVADIKEVSPESYLTMLRESEEKEIG